MTDAELPPSLTRLTFHGPLSEARASRLVARLTRDTANRARHRLRVGRTDAPHSRGSTGRDRARPRHRRGRPGPGAGQRPRPRAGPPRHVRPRVRARDPPRTRRPGVVPGGQPRAHRGRAPRAYRGRARRVRRLVNPGGRVLLGEGFWHRTPTEAELARMWPGTTAGEFGDLASLVDLAVGAGFRPAWIETATGQEWEDFESGTSATRRSGSRPTATTPRPPRSGSGSTSTARSGCAANTACSARPT